jgi:ATP-dependent Clp protease ATP-binding subunit ClpA
MSELTPAASLAWRIAAAEASGAKYRQIETAHLLVGILSLEKVRNAPKPELGLSEDGLASVRVEHGRLEYLLGRVGVSATELRRRMREALGRGDVANEKGPISRSEACKAAFQRAAQYAGSGRVSCLHLVAALTESPDDVLARTLDAARVAPRELRQHAAGFFSPAAPAITVPQEPTREELLRAMIHEIGSALKDSHGATLRVEAEAERFLLEKAVGPAGGPPELVRALERHVRTPLSELVLAGKIGRHSAWRVVYDEGGLYLLPDEAAAS